jgi:modulator of FtsH protease
MVERAHAREHAATVRTGGVSELWSTNRVLRNTYALLSLTLLFSAGTASAAMAVNMPYLGPWVTLGGYFGLLFLTHVLRNSAWGIVSVFALTGFMGLTLGPILEYYLTAVPNGGQTVALALGLTGAAFVGLSGYALVSRKDFGFMRGFLMVGMIALLGVIIASLFMDLSAFSLAISAGIVILMGAMILYQTGEIVNGGETNYILATVTLYVSIYNIFLSLLQILGVAGED